MANNNAGGQQCNIPEHEIKQNSGVSASMALQAGQKAWELRQAAHGAADAQAREEILAKAINKEIEAESFGKAAKYTQSGTFQGLAAGAGLGVQPGVTIGKLTGALVGGTISTVTGLLGGGIGSVYGAMNGPMWDLGQMASQGVQGVVGDFLPDVKSSPSQKKALEKMIMQTKETQAPSREELEQMKNEAPDQMPQSWSQSAKDMTAWRPSMPSAVKGVGAGIAGMGAAMNPWGGGQQQQNASQPKQQPQKQTQQAPSQPKQQTQPQPQKTSQPKPQQPKTNTQPPKQEKPQPSEPAKEAPKPRSQRPPTTRGPANPQSSAQSTPPSQQKQTPNTQQTPSKPATANQSKTSPANKSANSSQPKRVSFSDNKENNAPAAAEKPKRKPRKLGQQGSGGAAQKSNAGKTETKKAPRKLEARKPAAAAA
jgi:hypothetical protein